ncbi:MAG: S-layer homology domain-containing protein [Oscillospiraceae bacterium]|nr:S-layer homology domain-containing protein [Oscillospiraceae bacterium]
MRKQLKRLLAFLLVAITVCSAAAPALALTPTYRVTKAFAESRYYKELVEVELTGNYRADLINIALTQVGYHEGENSADRNGMNLGNKGNWTEYGYYCECDGYAWCAMFITWCARQAQIPQSVICDSRLARSYSFGVDFEKRGEYMPQIGDLVFFVEPGQEWTHVGLVLEVNDTGIYSIEGNTRDQVRVRYYEFDDEYIKGYGPYESEPCTSDMIVRDNIYKANFDLNGGEGKRRKQYTTEGDPLCLYANAPDETADDDETMLEPEHNDWCWKEGHDFEGWYVQRDSDGMWLTERSGWRDAESVAQKRYDRKIYGDLAGVYIDASWGGEDYSSYTFYAVWRSQETGKLVDETAFIATYDSTGWANTFKDLKESDPYYAAAKDIINRGLINGTDENIFGADGALTRAQFLAMLYRYDGEPAINTSLPYTDVKAEDWFYDAASWAYRKGVAPKGEQLKPNMPLSREEAVQYLYNYALITDRADAISDKDITLDIVRTLLAFSDISVLSPAYLEAVLWTYGNGILRSVEVDGRSMLQPKTTVTRGEACRMLSAWLSLE